MSLKRTLLAALAAAAPIVATAGSITPPAAPGNLVVPDGNKPFMIAYAVGTQNYICKPNGAAPKWVLFGPQATLFNASGEQIATHFLSFNPAENNVARATWQHSRDTSAAWAVMQQESDDPDFVEPGAVKWLLLKVVGAQYGPDHGKRLARTTFIQRVNTSGGVAPASGCATLEDLGKTALVPYTTDYVFYRAAE